jgi:hypothetical protein
MGVGPIPCELPSTSLPRSHVSSQSKTGYPAFAGEVGPSRKSNAGGKTLSRLDYYLDESDPDIAVLRRQDGTFVAAFSAQGATSEGIVEAAREDHYVRSMGARAESAVLRGEEDQQERSV